MNKIVRDIVPEDSSLNETWGRLTCDCEPVVIWWEWRHDAGKFRRQLPSGEIVTCFAEIAEEAVRLATNAADDRTSVVFEWKGVELRATRWHDGEDLVLEYENKVRARKPDAASVIP